MGKDKGFHHKEVDEFGNIRYYDENYRYHREGGPAIEGKNGSSAYYKYGMLHNLEGMAVVYPNGCGGEYWIEGIQYHSSEKWAKKVAEIKDTAQKVQEGEKPSKALDKTGESEQVASTKENGTMNKIISTIKSDNKKAARRVLAHLTSKRSMDLLVEFLGRNSNKREKASLRSSLERIFATDDGKALFSLTLGSILPQISAYFGGKYAPLIEEMAEEFRVQGFEHFQNEIVDFAAGPAFSMAKELVKSQLEAYETAASFEQVRVDTSEVPSHDVEPVAAVANIAAHRRKAQ